MIEYRYLQVVLSHEADERLTLGLIYWDGSSMRVAYSKVKMRMLLNLCGADYSAIPVGARALLDSAAKVRRRGSLSKVYPVREGFGAALYWSPVHKARPSDAYLLFRELCRLARLEVGR